MATINSLPDELVLKIISDLDYTSTVALSQVNHHLHSKLLPPKEDPIHRSEYLSGAELWNENKSLFACHQCRKLLPADHFSDKQMKRTRTKGHADSGRRFCLLCGIDRAIYHPGNAVRLHGRIRYLCKSCMRFRGGWFCMKCYWCVECLGVDDGICFPHQSGHTHIDIINSGVAEAAARGFSPPPADGGTGGFGDSDGQEHNHEPNHIHNREQEQQRKEEEDKEVMKRIRFDEPNKEDCPSNGNIKILPIRYNPDHHNDSNSSEDDNSQRSSRRPAIKCPRCSLTMSTSIWLSHADPEVV